MKFEEFEKYVERCKDPSEREFLRACHKKWAIEMTLAIADLKEVAKEMDVSVEVAALVYLTYAVGDLEKR